MKFTSVKFTQEYSSRGLSNWIGGEISVEDGEELAALRRLKETCDKFNKEIGEERETGLPETQIKESLKTDELYTAAYEKVVQHLSTFSNQEDAAAYLDTTEFRHTISAKQIVNSKPKKL